MYLKLEVGSKIHNRFEIEVRDARTGEIKQRGQAENIILNRMYERLCNFNSYFNYIHFGKGEGALDTSRNVLFDELGYKQAVTEEIIKDFPVSRWVRKIVLNPEEYIGESITEVGISDTYSSSKSSSYINTHALIKDAEGNLLNILKTDTDVVVIYATVFIELQNRSENIRFDERPANPLITYLTGGSAPSNKLSIGTFSGDTPYFVGMEMGTKELTRMTNINERKIIYTTRLGIDEANNVRISELGLQKVFRCNLTKSNVWDGYRFQQRSIGIGDGSTTIYELLDNKLSDTNIFIDGILTTDFSLDNSDTDLPYIHLSEIVEPNEINSDVFGSPYNYVTIAGMETHVFKVNPDKALGKTLIISGRTNSTGDWSMYVYGSYDNVTYKLIGQISTRSSTVFDVKIEEPFEYLKFNGGWSGNVIHLIAIRGKRSSLIFNTPPPEGAVITADYTVPYIPKTEDYVLDVTCEIQFGEGV